MKTRQEIRQFVNEWLEEHRSPVEVEQATDEEQEHFVSILCDLLEAFQKTTNK